MTDTDIGSVTSDSHDIFIAMGSNLGDRLHNLNEAINNLPSPVIPQNISPVYETPPWGYEKQPAFLNQVVHARTELTPVELLSYIKKIEVALGRQPTFRNGPRIIDLDILFYDQLVINTPVLTIPHPRLGERAFVLVTLADLDPELRHPITGKTVREMLDRNDTQSIQLYQP